MEFSSPAFNHRGFIPPVYTCDGENISPPLNWTGAPDTTKSFVLICEDPDAPIATWDHWVLFNIPPSITTLEEDLKTLPPGVNVGKNSWKRSEWGGPCPPDGMHRYFFTLYALDDVLNLKNGVFKKDVLKALEGHVLEKINLIGLYERPLQP